MVNNEEQLLLMMEMSFSTDMERNSQMLRDHQEQVDSTGKLIEHPAHRSERSSQTDLSSSMPRVAIETTRTANTSGVLPENFYGCSGEVHSVRRGLTCYERQQKRKDNPEGVARATSGPEGS